MHLMKKNMLTHIQKRVVLMFFLKGNQTHHAKIVIDIILPLFHFSSHLQNKYVYPWDASTNQQFFFFLYTLLIIGWSLNVRHADELLWLFSFFFPSLA